VHRVRREIEQTVQIIQRKAPKSLGSSVPSLFQEIDRSLRPLAGQFDIASPKPPVAFLTIFAFDLVRNRAGMCDLLSTLVITGYALCF
jgi:hypothetical protein